MNSGCIIPNLSLYLYSAFLSEHLTFCISLRKTRDCIRVYRDSLGQLTNFSILDFLTLAKTSFSIFTGFSNYGLTFLGEPLSEYHTMKNPSLKSHQLIGKPHHCTYCEDCLTFIYIYQWSLQSISTRSPSGFNQDMPHHRS